MKKIFIIDKDINISYGLQAKFRIKNFDVANCENFLNVRDVIAQIINHRPDYIVQGMVFPNFSGVDLVRAIKENNEISDIPIFIYTKKSGEEKKKYHNLGAEYFYMKKDLNFDQFAEKVIKIIGNKKKIKKEN